MLQALEPYRDCVSVISAASVGGLNGAMFALDKTEEMIDLWKNIRRKDVYTRWPLLKPCASSLFSTKPLAALIDKHVDGVRLAAMPTTLRIHAVEYGSGCGVSISSRERNGLLTNRWLLAGASIPVVFPPVQIDGRWYQDGGVWDNTPLAALIQERCTRIVVLHCSPQRTPQYISERPPTRWAQAAGMIGMFMRATQDWDSRYLKKINDAVTGGNAGIGQRYIELIDVYPTTRVGTLDFDGRKLKAAVAHGYEQAAAALDQVFRKP